MGQKLGYKYQRRSGGVVILLTVLKTLFLIIFLVEHLYAFKLKASRGMEIGCMGYKK